ncbi:MAG: hypothetical protein KF798_05635 [Candidatus Paracaedibacteraceae bacterium]|nr:hypothetical protein [Candidatus Paracaedibacteraceae bacterium]
MKKTLILASVSLLCLSSAFSSDRTDRAQFGVPSQGLPPSADVEPHDSTTQPSSNPEESESLDLEDNGIGDVGRKAIEKSQALRNLTSLDLEDNGIGDVGRKAIEKSQALRNLTSLDLKDHRIGDEGTQP